MYGPPQPDQPWPPPVPPGTPGNPGTPEASGPPPPGPFSKQPSDPGPYTPLPPPVDPYTPQPTGPEPYGAPPPPSGPYGAPPPPPGPYGAPPPPPGPYGAPPGYSAPPPYSAPPVQSAPPTSGWPPASGPPTMTWPLGAPPPPPRKSSRTVAIILGITVPIFVIIASVIGLVIGPKLLNQAQDDPTSQSTTPPAVEDPLAVPAVGSCHLVTLDATPFHDRADDGRAVPCDQSHSLETIASGAIDDSARPDEFSDRAHELYGQCEQAAQEFLGTIWRSTYSWVVLSLPSQGAWDSGAHWYRCDIALNDGFYQSSPVRTEGSLRGAAEPITCLTWFEDDTSLTEIEQSGCDVEHQGELAAVLPVPDGLDLTNDDAVVDALSDACEPAVLEFLGADALPEELTFWFSYPDVGDFDQWVLCMLSAEEANRGLTASLHGLGSGEVPFV